MIVILLPIKSFGQTFTEHFDSNPCGSDLCTTTNFIRNLGGVDFEFTFQSSGDGGDFSYETENGDGNSPSINLLSGSFNTGTNEAVTIKRIDSGEFNFNSIYINNTDAQTITIQGYNNSSTVGSSQSVPMGSSNTLNFGGITVDEIRITSTDFYNINLDSFSGEIASSNNTPSDLSLDNTSINQSATGAGSVVGNLSTTDADGGDTHTYALVSNGASDYGSCGTSGDDDNASLQVDNTNDDLETGGSLLAGSYNVCIETDDGTDSYQESFSITVNDTNDEPTLTATGSDPTFTEGGSAAGLYSGTSVSTVESGQTIQGMTLTVSNVTNGSNERINVDGSAIVLTHGTTGTTATNSLSYSVSVVGTTATVSVSGGTLSTAAAETLFNNMSYQNNSNNPSTDNRVITITSLQDSGGTANGGDDTASLSVASAVTVVGINDEPTLTATGSDPTFTEGGSAASLYSGSSVSTIEAGQTIAGLTLTVTNVSDGTDEILNIDGSAVRLTDGTAGTTASNSLSYSVSVSGTTATVSLGGGTLSMTAAQTLIDNMTYQNNSVDPSTDNRVVIITSITDSGGTANGGDETASLSITSIVSIQLDAPPTGYTVSWDDALINASEASAATFTVSNAEVGATINYSVSSSGDGNTATVSGSTSATSSTQQVTTDVSSLTDGILTVEVSMTDDGGNTGDTETDNSATLDQTAPSGYSVSIDQSPINAANDEAVSFTFAGAEVGTDYSYTFSSSGGGTNVTGSGTIATVTDQIMGIDLSGLGDGTITLSVTLTNTNGNTGTAATDTETKGTTAPSGYSVAIDLLGEPQINVINESIIEFSGSGLEVGTTLNYTFTSDGGGTPVTGTETVTATSEQFDNGGAGYDLSGLTDGTVTLSVSLTDNAGNRGADATVSETKDAGPPTGYTVAWDDTFINAAEATTASFTVSNTEIGATINNSVSSSGDGNTATVSNPTVVTSNTQVVTIDVSSLVDGTLTVEVALADGGGNTGGAVSDNSATLDQTVPSGYSVAIDQSPINEGNDDAASFTFSGAEVDATYNYTFSSSGGGSNVTGSGTISTATDQITGIDLSGLGVGTITLSVTLTDEAGNTGSVATDTETKQQNPEASDGRIFTESEVEYIFTPSDFSTTELDYSIKIESLPAKGSLKLSNSDVSAGDEIAVSSIDNDLLTWMDASDDYGYGYTSFDFKVINDSDVESSESYTLFIDLGSRTVQLTSGKGWRFLSSPSSDNDYANIFSGVNVDLPPAEYPSLYELDQPTYTWEAVQSLSTSPERGEGFIFYGKLGEMSASLTFDGVWNDLSDTFEYSELGYDGTGQSSNPDNFYLVGNPHPFAMDFCEFDLSHVSETITFWDPETGAGDYVSKSCEIEKGIEIAPFQSFWIRTTDVHPAASIPEEAYLNSSSGGYFKEKSSDESGQPLITLNLSSEDNAFANQLYILFSENGEDGLDSKDAPKLSASGLTSEWLSFYSMDQNGKAYAIQALPYPSEDSQLSYGDEQNQTVLEIPLNVETTEDGFFTMDWTLSDLTDLDARVYLKDNNTGYAIDLNSQQQYSFMLNPTVEKAKSQESLQVSESQPLAKFTETEQNVRFTLFVDYGAPDQNTVDIDLPEQFSLEQNYPNPFNPVTVIQFQLASQSNVELSVYDLTGRQVATLVDKPMQAGNHQVSFNAQDLSSGVYIYTIKAGAQMLSRKLTIVK